LPSIKKGDNLVSETDDVIAAIHDKHGVTVSHAGTAATLEEAVELATANMEDDANIWVSDENGNLVKYNKETK
jgi:methylmalonyl-CoA mutase cobalamin-binding subunit